MTSTPNLAADESKGLRAELENACAEISRLKEVNHNLLTLLGHELGTPLTVMLAFLRLWQEGHTPVDPEELQLVVEQALRLKGRLADLMLIDQLEAGTWHSAPERLSLNDMVKQVLDSQQSLIADKHIKFHSNLNTFNEPVLADREMLFQVLDHLVGNAVKFSPYGGSVRLAVRKLRGYCALTITDHGIGISSEARSRIFESFSQEDSSLARRYDGLGLGLFLVKSLIKIHGGEVELDSTPGHGSSFRVTIPLAAPKHQRYSELNTPLYASKLGAPAS